MLKRGFCSIKELKKAEAREAAEKALFTTLPLTPPLAGTINAFPLIKQTLLNFFNNAF